MRYWWPRPPSFPSGIEHLEPQMQVLAPSLRYRGNINSVLLTNATATTLDLKDNKTKMITRYLNEVTTVFNPFSPKAKTARLFLSFLPPNARALGMKVNTRMLPRISKEPSFVELKFSKKLLGLSVWGLSFTFMVFFFSGEQSTDNELLEDGKEMKLDAEKLGIKGVVEEVDRHSRILSRQEELTGNWGAFVWLDGRALYIKWHTGGVHGYIGLDKSQQYRGLCGERGSQVGTQVIGHSAGDVLTEPLQVGYEGYVRV